MHIRWHRQFNYIRSLVMFVLALALQGIIEFGRAILPDTPQGRRGSHVLGGGKGNIFPTNTIFSDINNGRGRG